MVDIWPISYMAFPIGQSIAVEGVVNSYGDGQEQRINTGLPRTRADGQGGIGRYIGVRSFTVKVSRLQYLSNPVSTNAYLNNSAKELWKFFLKQFYDSVNNRPVWKSFYWYNPVENDNVDTWTGDDASNGRNSRNEIVLNTTGRYRVRFAGQEMTLNQLNYCIFDIGLELLEVVE